jgi:hypothetical protein
MSSARRATNPGLPLLFALAALASACSSSPGPIQISLTTTESPDARIRVSGLSSSEASSLAAATLDAAAWTELLRVTIGDDAAVAVAGRYSVAGRTIEFAPAFPLDAGRTYHVRFDPARLPSPRRGDVVMADLGLPARPATASVRVTKVYPSADEWPENLLRFYVHFSGPMARQTGAGRVHLLDADGHEVTDALLPASVDFWSPDQMRYTVLFDPGRVKRGILPNLEKGRALVSGQTYTIAIDAGWLDAEGRPLAEGHRVTFRAGPARESALSLGDWRISAPASGSRDTLIIATPEPLDHALFGRVVGVASPGGPLDGQVDVTRGETEWRFTPTAPWRQVPHEIIVLSALEDPAGNRIGRAFEVLPTDPAANADLPERFTLPLTIR